GHLLLSVLRSSHLWDKLARAALSLGKLLGRQLFGKAFDCDIDVSGLALIARDGQPFVRLHQVLRNSVSACVLRRKHRSGHSNTLIRRRLKPGGGCLGIALRALAVEITHAHTELRLRQALLGGRSKPLRRFIPILRDSLPKGVHYANPVLSGGMTL